MAIVLTEESINFNEKRIIRCKVYTAKNAQVIQWRPHLCKSRNTVLSYIVNLFTFISNSL